MVLVGPYPSGERARNPEISGAAARAIGEARVLGPGTPRSNSLVTITENVGRPAGHRGGKVPGRSVVHTVFVSRPTTPPPQADELRLPSHIDDPLGGGFLDAADPVLGQDVPQVVGG